MKINHAERLFQAMYFGETRPLQMSPRARTSEAEPTDGSHNKDVTAQGAGCLLGLLTLFCLGLFSGVAVPRCPNCGMRMVRQGGKWACPKCGYVGEDY